MGLMTSIKREQSLTEPIGGSHHCIGTAHGIVDLTFRYLHAACASHGGSLTEADLTAAQFDLLESFSSTLDFFELIHQRCMRASGVTAPAVFKQGAMLASLLFICSQRTAEHCFSLQIEQLGAEWLRLYFDALSNSIRRHINSEAETNLTGAYAKVAGDLRQKLTIKKLLQERDVQKVLLDCIMPFDLPKACDDMAVEFGDEINQYTGKMTGSVSPHVSKITNNQIRNFLMLFPREVRMILDSPPVDGATMSTVSDGAAA